jgi:hypothetical protein
MSYLGADYGEHRRADAQTSCDSAGSSDPGHYRTEPLLITGDKTRDAALGAPRIRAGEIIGWRFWKLRNGLLYSVFVPYTWRPGVFERSSSKQSGFKNPGYHCRRRRSGHEVNGRPERPDAENRGERSLWKKQNEDGQDRAKEKTLSTKASKFERPPRQLFSMLWH